MREVIKVPTKNQGTSAGKSLKITMHLHFLFFHTYMGPMGFSKIRFKMQSVAVSCCAWHQEIKKSSVYACFQIPFARDEKKYFE